MVARRFKPKNNNLGKFWTNSGLPDGLFSNQKSQCWRALDWKILVCFMATWNISRTFGILYDHLVHSVFIWYIYRFWYHVPRHIWQPCCGQRRDRELFFVEIKIGNFFLISGTFSWFRELWKAEVD
jgi:hypothetical protein